MSGTEIRRFSGDRSLKGGRWIAGLLQAFSTSLATGLALPIVVLAAYVALLTGDLYRIALVPVLSFGLWNLGALVAGRVTKDRLRMLPWAFGGSVVRAAAMGVIAYVAYHADPASDNRLTTFFIGLGLLGFASGFVSVPLEGLLQKAFESSSRTQLFAGRAFWSLIAAVLSGIVVRSVFETDAVDTQRGFAYLFIAATGCLASAAFFTLLVKEPARRLSTARHSHSGHSLSALGDRVMRRYLLFRVALAAVGMLDVFIVIYALRELRFDRQFLGTYVLVFCAAAAIGWPAARAVSAKRGGRAVMQSSVWLKLIAPVTLLTIPYLRGSRDVADRVSGDRTFLWMVAVCFVALGLSLAFQFVGNFQYLSEIAPAINRASYFTTANIVLMLATLFSLLGAWIVDRWDFQRLFAVSAALALLAVLLSGILIDNRIVASRPATSARLNRVSLH